MDSTIRLAVETKSELDKLKVHPNQSYDEVIIKMVNRIKLQDEMAKHIKVTKVEKK